MNKKFLSAILFGALMVTSTGTFVSCKDYDDEIDDLQEQINKLATKEDMTSQIASLQSALTAAQSEAAAAKASAEDALKKAQEALDNVSAGSDEAVKLAAQAAADAAQAAKDAADAKVEAIKAAQDEVAKVKAELEASIDSKFEAAKGEFAETIAELTKKVEDLTGYTTSMVTSIHLMEESTNWGTYDTNLDLNYYRVTKVVYPENLQPDKIDNITGKKTLTTRKEAASYTFGGDLEGAFEIKKGDVNTVPDYLLVNVAPVNAAVSDESLLLINAAGVTVNNYVNLSAYSSNANIYKWRSRSASTGLYEVGVQLKNDVDFEAFDKLVIGNGNNHSIDTDKCTGIDEHNYIGYALAISDASRSVTSDFDVTMHVQKEQKAVDIEYNSKLYSNASKNENGEQIVYYADGGDAAHNWENCFSVENNIPFALSVSSAYDNGNGGRVMASYVIVDKDNAELSVADKAALKLVEVTGDVNKVSYDLYHTIKVGGTDAVGIPVPLKLVTIDYTGNVEVNVFWVKVGDAKSMTAAFSVTPSINVAKRGGATKWTAESTMEEFKVPAGAEYYSITWTIGETTHEGYYRSYTTGVQKLSGINTYGILKLYESDKRTPATSPSKINYAEFVGSINLQVMKDDGTEYVGSIKFYDKTGTTYLGYNELTVKKVLPADIPVGLTAKTGVIHADGSMPIYPKPQADKNGEFALSEAFNISTGANGSIDLVSDTNLKFNTGLIPNENFNANKHVAHYNGRKIVDIASWAIGEDEKYPTTVTYDYGDIKYHPEGHGVEEPDNCIVEWSTKFDIVFGCYVRDSEFAWYTEPTVVYSKDIVIDAYETDSDGKKTYYNFMTAKNPYKLAIDPFSNLEKNGWMPWAAAFSNDNTTIELWSNGDEKKVNEFFKAEFTAQNGKTCLKLTATQKSYTAVPENDVPTTVVFKFKDNFGHDEAIKALTFTMKKNAE